MPRFVLIINRKDNRNMDLGTLLKSHRTLVMGILNITPDSFSDGGQYNQINVAIERALQMKSEGADIIDIGGESTRPGASPVPLEEEIKRVIPVVEALKRNVDITLSIDTVKPEVAQLALEAGATLINDISAGGTDSHMAEVVAEHKAWVCLMHMQGEPRTMQTNPHYDDVVMEVREFLSDRASQFIKSGVPSDKIILDPGIGFGKTVEHNLTLLAQLDSFISLGFPILVGLSRKSFLGKLTGIDNPAERLLPGIAANTVSVWNGAKIVRVHDVKETVTALKVADALLRYRKAIC